MSSSSVSPPVSLPVVDLRSCDEVAKDASDPEELGGRSKGGPPSASSTVDGLTAILAPEKAGCSFSDTGSSLLPVIVGFRAWVEISRNVSSI